jgi:hypothetical protein
VGLGVAAVAIATVVALLLWSRSTNEARSAPPANFKVAFIGDSGDDESFRQVLRLIRDEGADMVVHNGDFSYEDGTALEWEQAVGEILGPTFPYVGSDGNHDGWSEYVDFFGARLEAMDATIDVGSLESASYAFTYENIRFVFSKEDGDPIHVAQGFAADQDVIWKVAGWHKTMTAMQVGNKGDQQGWGDYEEARLAGAIITTAHEHSYSRTKTLSDIPNRVVALNERFRTEVRSGETFVVVSGLGGRPIRDQERCLPATPPYGCPEWALIYTSSQEAKHGALFITMNLNGDPAKGLGEFVNVDAEIFDRFTITVKD